MKRTSRMVVVAAAFTVACQGVIAGVEESAAGPGPSETPEMRIARCVEAAPQVGSVEARMLNRRELARSYADVLELDAADVRARVMDQFPPDPAAPFDTQAANLVASTLLVEQQVALVAALSAEADLSTLLPCASDSSTDTSCFDELLATVGRRAFRRVLREEEKEPLRAVYEDALTTGRAPQQAMSLVLQGLLLSPQFTYRVEAPVNTDQPELVSADERASRLAYLLWGSIPDPELLDAAASGALMETAELERHARRMLEDRRAHTITEAFHALWLDTGLLINQEKADPSFEALVPSMVEETRLFTEHAFWHSDAGATDYLLSNAVFADGLLAEHYDLPGPTGREFERLDGTGTMRGGVLSHASILANYSNPDRTSPTKRGKFVWDRLLCRPPDPAPDDVEMELPPVDEGGTMRERLAMHASNPECAACHTRLDPVGFGLEVFDTVGRFRSEEAGAPVNATGVLVGLNEEKLAFDGPQELARHLAESEGYYDCISLQWFRFAMGRAETRQDECSLVAIRDQFRSTGYNMRELLVSIILSDAFLYKSQQPEEPTELETGAGR